MLIKLDTIALKPLPDVLTIHSPQKIAEIEIPNLLNVLQDFGPGAKAFSLSGIIKNNDGGLLLALSGIDELKRKGKDVLFHFDKLSWKVRIRDINYQVLRRRHVRYTIEMQETAKPKEYLFIRDATMHRPDRMQQYVTLAKARAKAFSLRGALNRIYNAMNRIDQYLSNVREILRDIQNLAELPLNLVNRLKFELSMIDLTCEIIKLETYQLITANTIAKRTYSAFEDMLSYVHLMVESIGTESQFMWVQADSLPKKEKTYIVEGDDTIQSISLKFYNTINRWTDICYANHLTDPTSIEVGDTLTIPQ
jgi:hypothetical protein